MRLPYGGASGSSNKTLPRSFPCKKTDTRARPASLARHALWACALACSAAALAAPPGLERLTIRITGPSPFAAGCNGVAQTGTPYPNAEVEPFVAANPAQRLNLVSVWQQDRWSDGGSQGLGTAYSVDGGLHWSRIFVPFTRCAGGSAANGGDYERGSDPWVSISPNGAAQQMVLAFNPSATGSQVNTAMLASRSVDGGRSWGPIQTLVANDVHRFNDKNAITADPTDARFVYAVWDRLSDVAGEGAGPTLLARSSDNGRSYEPARIIYDPGPNAQTIGNRIEVLPGGMLVNLFTQIDYQSGDVTLRVIRSSDKGLTWSQPILVADILALGASDPQTGAPIRDGAILAQMAINRRGVIGVTWQDARHSGGRLDGVVFSQSTDGGLSWSEPVQINRDPSVQAFTPSIHARRDGSFGVGYYDLRSNTGDPATLFTDTWLTRTREGTVWREDRVSEPFDLSRAPNALGLFLGDYQGLTSIGPVFIPFFAKSGGPDSNRNDIYAHISLGHVMEDAARDAPALDAAVAQDEAALAVHTPQAAAQLAATQRSALHSGSWQAYERLMRAHVPQWDARFNRRLQAP